MLPLEKQEGPGSRPCGFGHEPASSGSYLADPGAPTGHTASGVGLGPALDPQASAHGWGASRQPCSPPLHCGRSGANVPFLSHFCSIHLPLGSITKYMTKSVGFPQLRPTRHFPLSLRPASPWSLSKRDEDRSTHANGNGYGLGEPRRDPRSPVLPDWLPPQQGSINGQSPPVGPLPSAPSTIPQASPLAGPEPGAHLWSAHDTEAGESTPSGLCTQLEAVSSRRRSDHEFMSPLPTSSRPPPRPIPEEQELRGAGAGGWERLKMGQISYVLRPETRSAAIPPVMNDSVSQGG